MGDGRHFEVTGRIFVEREDVIAFLNDNSNEEYDEDYQPTDAEYMGCAEEQFKRYEAEWTEWDFDLLGG